MGIFLQFKRLFHDQSYLSVIVIYRYCFLVQETAPQKTTGRINLINTWLILIPSLLKYFTAFLHETTYPKD